MIREDIIGLSGSILEEITWNNSGKVKQEQLISPPEGKRRPLRRYHCWKGPFAQSIRYGK
jgi:hypothetical protein